MILSGKEIVSQVKNGSITIEPFNTELLNPNSYNYRLSNILLEVNGGVIEPREPTEYKKIIITEEGYVIKPGRLYLGATLEQIGSSIYVTSLIGRSSVGRLGLFVQITADMSSLGAKHHWTLELHATQPVKVYPGMRIGQVSFWEVEGNRQLQYRGKYANHTKPHFSKLHEEMDEKL